MGLVLQLCVVAANPAAHNGSLITTLINFFGFFTVLTNLLIAIGLTLALTAPATLPGAFFSRASVQAAMAAYIALVGGGYAWLLRPLWNPQGVQKLADVLLHDAVPVTYLAYWLIFAPKSKLGWRNLSAWVVYPVTYLVYTLVRGAHSAWYPYPFLDVRALGYRTVALNILALAVTFVGISGVVIALSRLKAYSLSSDLYS
jgi:hypothetical protein